MRKPTRDTALLIRVNHNTEARMASRAAIIGISRNEWTNRAILWALDQPLTPRPKPDAEHV